MRKGGEYLPTGWRVRAVSDTERGEYPLSGGFGWTLAVLTTPLLDLPLQ